MKFFKTGITGTLCVMATPLMAQTEFKAQKDFIDHIDECHWLTNDQKEIFKQLPPLDQYAKELIKEENAKIQDENKINCKKAKLKAIRFYSKYLEYLPPEYLTIATSIIEKGEYIYSKERFSGAYGSCMVVIPHDKNLDKKEKDDISDRLTSDIDDILSGISHGEMRDKELNLIRKQYLDKDKITENFGIKVVYNNSTELTIQIIHETAHVLDYAYRIKNDIYTENAKGMNHESISLFFELLARQEYIHTLYDKERLIELYREMLQHDYLRRIRQTDYSLRDKLIEQVRKDWSSPLDQILNYVDFEHNETYDGTKEALEKITKYEQPVDPADYTHIHNIGRAFEILTQKNPKPGDIPSIFNNLVKEETRQISAKTFEKWLYS